MRGNIIIAKRTKIEERKFKERENINKEFIVTECIMENDKNILNKEIIPKRNNRKRTHKTSMNETSQNGIIALAIVGGIGLYAIISGYIKGGGEGFLSVIIGIFPTYIAVIGIIVILIANIFRGK